jgi:radical SAM protein with 4Fe4S-binding SPASM domain
MVYLPDTRTGTAYHIIPTSYGAVIQYFSSDRVFSRVYLNSYAVHVLLNASGTNDSADSQALRKMLATRGLDWDAVLGSIQGLESEIKECEQIIKKNGWLHLSYHPLQISLQLVTRCNARCWFCYNDSPQSKDDMIMPSEAVRKAKDYAAEHGSKIGMSGGEPTLHPELFELLEYRKDEVFDTLITNLCTDIDLKKLVRTEVDLVQVSLHGFGKYHDESIGLPGAFDKVKKRILAIGGDINVGTNTVVTENNMDGIEKLLCTLSDIQKQLTRNLAYSRFVLALPSGGGLDTVKLRDPLILKFNRLMEGLVDQYPDINFEIPVFHANRYEYFERDGLFLCPAGTTVCTITPDGKFTPCNQFAATETLSEMRLTEQNIHDIWLKDGIFQKWRRGIPTKVSQPASGASCALCSYLTLKDRGEVLSRRRCQ